MVKRFRLLLTALIVMLTVQALPLYAQKEGGGAAASAPAAPAATAAKTPASTAAPKTGDNGNTEDQGMVTKKPGFVDIVFRQGMVNLLIWCLIFVSSFATIALIIDGALAVKREKILPAVLVNGVRDSLDEGDLGQAIAVCEQNPGPLSNILMAGFSNINEGYEVIQESVAAATDLESEKIMQRINYLNLCGQIAPMLGLLGTVTGMVSAFANLSTTGPARDRLLAVSISTALWTTVAGLLISVPALLAFTVYKNLATKVLLESEATVLDLLKILRSAEVEEEYEEE